MNHLCLLGHKIFSANSQLCTYSMEIVIIICPPVDLPSLQYNHKTIQEPHLTCGLEFADSCTNCQRSVSAIPEGWREEETGAELDVSWQLALPPCVYGTETKTLLLGGGRAG